MVFSAVCVVCMRTFVWRGVALLLQGIFPFLFAVLNSNSSIPISWRDSHNPEEITLGRGRHISFWKLSPMAEKENYTLENVSFRRKGFFSLPQPLTCNVVHVRFSPCESFSFHKTPRSVIVA